MCDCEEFEFTINRGDEFMITKNPAHFCYNIGAEDLWNLLVYLKKYYIVKDVWKSDDGAYVQVRADQHSVQRIAFGAFLAGVLAGAVVSLIVVFYQIGVR